VIPLRYNTRTLYITYAVTDYAMTCGSDISQ